jgi:hypothetical protein
MPGNHIKIFGLDDDNEDDRLAFGNSIPLFLELDRTWLRKVLFGRHGHFGGRFRFAPLVKQWRHKM